MKRRPVGRKASLIMRALRKLDGPATPTTGLRTVQSLCFVPPAHPRFELLMDHPPIEKPIAALAEIARELGRPARS